MIDYPKIIKAYMTLVANSEGITFIEGPSSGAEGLTDEEERELMRIHDELTAEWAKERQRIREELK